MVLLLWAGATGVDMGFSIYGSRQAQSIADTAALDLARYLGYADTLSSIGAVQAYLNGKLATVLTNNGSNAQLTVVPGYYNSATKKFTADGFNGNSCQPVVAPQIPHPGCNAVEVTASQSVPQLFFGGFNLLSGHAGSNVTGAVSGSSIGVQNPVAGFSLGAYLTNVTNTQSAVLNALLSVLGSSVGLSASSYQGFVTGNVTLAQLISASGGLLTASNVMSAQLTAGQWLSVYDNAVGNAYGTGSAPYLSLQSLGTFSSAQSTDVTLCQMVNIDIASTQYDCSNSSLAQQGLDASVNVLQMLISEAELANGTNGIDVTSALNLNSALAGDPGLSVNTVKLSTVLGTPARVAYGPAATVANDAQVQTTLSMNLVRSGASIGTLSIPLSAVTGTATLSSMNCVDDALYSMTIAPVTTTASSSGTNGVTLTLQGNSTAQGTFTSGTSSNSASFTGSANPAGADFPPTTATASAGTNPEARPTNWETTSPPVLTWSPAGGANSDVSYTMGVLDSAYGPVLQALGITVGGATIAGLAADCGTVSLVQ